MAKIRARAPHALLRALLLVLGLAMVAGLAVLLAAHRFAARSPAPAAAAPAPPQGLESTAPDELFRGEGFEYTQYGDAGPIFTIRAKGNRQDRSDTAYLHDVELVLHRRDGADVRVTSDDADYNQRSHQAELRGHVKLRSAELELDARALRLLEGQVLISSGAVAFRYPPNLVGRASTLRLDLEAERYTLAGGVHLRSTPASPIDFTLDSLRLNYDRPRGLLRVLGEVRLARGEDLLETENLTIYFDGDLSQLKALRANVDVRGTMMLAGEDPDALRATFAGSTLRAQLDPATGEPTRLELEGDGGERSSFALASASGLRQSLDGRFLVAYLKRGRMRLIEAYGDPLELVETIDLEPPFLLRHACAGRGEVRFDDAGEIGRVRLESQVELFDRQLFIAGGAEATIDWASGTLEVGGPEVALLSPRAEVSAPRFVYRRDRGLIRAEDGVRALLRDAATDVLAHTPLARGDGPILVDAERANWTVEPPGFTFLGNVRAWRGQSLILADQLRGDERDQQITASGPVKTVWVPEVGAGAAAEPIEVRAARMSYRRAERALVYSGEVTAEQGGRRLSCRELYVELDAAGQAERLRCLGKARLDDPRTARRVEGERAVYTLAEQRVEVFGERVSLREANGNSVIGKYLTYDVASGAMEVRSLRPDRPAAGAPAELPPAAGGRR
ncbi:MAG: hypothetical protein D6696_13290 [Acidobacteria bacterium]|nr:MAG: hypothetical protein D6696_13290 [Acidobacteriota bacterium]